MRLYHGSSCVVERPDVTYSRGNLDFGRGFYATSYAHQAESWALRKAAVQHAGAFVSEYDMAEAFDEYHVLRFDQPDEKWVRFVCDCRKGADVYKGYDLIIEALPMTRSTLQLTCTIEASGIWRRHSRHCGSTR